MKTIKCLIAVLCVLMLRIVTFSQTVWYSGGYWYGQDPNGIGNYWGVSAQDYNNNPNAAVSYGGTAGCPATPIVLSKGPLGVPYYIPCSGPNAGKTNYTRPDALPNGTVYPTAGTWVPASVTQSAYMTNNGSGSVPYMIVDQNGAQIGDPGVLAPGGVLSIANLPNGESVQFGGQQSGTPVTDGNTTYTPTIPANIGVGASVTTNWVQPGGSSTTPPLAINGNTNIPAGATTVNSANNAAAIAGQTAALVAAIKAGSTNASGGSGPDVNATNLNPLVDTTYTNVTFGVAINTSAAPVYNPLSGANLPSPTDIILTVPLASLGDMGAIEGVTVSDVTLDMNTDTTISPIITLFRAFTLFLITIAFLFAMYRLLRTSAPN